MNRIDGSVLLVGSVPGDDAEEVLRYCAGELGGRLSIIPDGETNLRRVWINILAATIYSTNESMETINQPQPIDPDDPDEWRGKNDGWIPRGYNDHWQFRVKDGAELRFDSLGYADAAIESYQVFKRLRDEGLISAEQRFMVAMPMRESATRPFMAMAGEADYNKMADAYTEAMSREIPMMMASIPANDLAIQWDVCMEMVAVDRDDDYEALFPWSPSVGAMERYCTAVKELSSFVPEEVPLGLHFCYGDLGHKHFIEPQDLGKCVEIAKESVRVIDRTIDFTHIPVPRDRDDDAYFKPLSSWPVEAGKLYLGLIHITGGAEASKKRVETAKRHIDDFGIATECGFGRRPKESLPELMSIHREIADIL
jgi:hypothetical protein